MHSAFSNSLQHPVILSAVADPRRSRDEESQSRKGHPSFRSNTVLAVEGNRLTPKDFEMVLSDAAFQ